MIFWLIGYLWKRAGWLRTAQIDVDTGRREIDWAFIEADNAKIVRKGGIYRIYRLFC